MRSRIQTLEKLRSLYGVVTYMHGVALEQATSAVRDAEARIDGERAMVRQSSEAGVAALSKGDKQEWLMQYSQRGFSERDADWLGAVRERREAELVAAAALYRENRMQLEQMQSVIKGVRSALGREQEHREQMESDDRFLSRQRWREREDEKLSLRGGIK